MGKSLDRDHWRAMLPIITAYVNGQKIDIKNGDKWHTDIQATFFDQSPEVYRIQPKPKYRPFKNASEARSLLLYGFVKDKSTTDQYLAITSFNDAGVFIENAYHPYDLVLDKFTTPDGDPLGVFE